MTLENLAQIGKLKPHRPAREEIGKLLAACRRHTSEATCTGAVRRNLKDARHTDLSAESRFDIALRRLCSVR